MPSVAGLELSDFTAATVILAFINSANGICAASYTIKTTANVSSPSITDTSVIITKPPNDPEGITYTVTVYAMDFAGRVGPPSSLDCFMFSGESTAA